MQYLRRKKTKEVQLREKRLYRATRASRRAEELRVQREAYFKIDTLLREEEGCSFDAYVAKFGTEENDATKHAYRSIMIKYGFIKELFALPKPHGSLVV